MQFIHANYRNLAFIGAAAPHLGEPKFPRMGDCRLRPIAPVAVPKVDMFSLRCYERRVSGRGICCSWSHKLLSQFDYQLSQCKQEPKKTSSCSQSSPIVFSTMDGRGLCHPPIFSAIESALVGPHVFGSYSNNGGRWSRTG